MYDYRMTKGFSKDSETFGHKIFDDENMIAQRSLTILVSTEHRCSFNRNFINSMMAMAMAMAMMAMMAMATSHHSLKAY
jgi:hypothetical protein